MPTNPHFKDIKAAGRHYSFAIKQGSSTHRSILTVAPKNTR